MTRPAFSIRLFLACASALIASGATGCMTEAEWNRWWDNVRGADKGGQPEPAPRSGPDSAARRGTIGPEVTIDGLSLQEVRGFGLVTNLVNTGGSDGPEVVKKYLVKEMRRRVMPGDVGLNSQEILEDPTTAMVEVTGWIPAGAKKGDRFDVVVRALGTESSSLVGGRLILCDLKQYADTPSGVIGGKTLATALGPVFVSPFDRDGRPAKTVNLRVGTVLGGGIAGEDRRVRFVLNQPEYSTASRIAKRINDRWGSVEPIAEALSHSYVSIELPPGKQHDLRRYLERIQHTTLNGSPAFLSERAKTLLDELTHPDADFESIALALEAIGKIILPDLRKRYTHQLVDASYHAGRVGLRLGDRDAADVVGRHALDPGSPYREDAIRELGEAEKLYSTGEYLRKLLDDAKNTIRIAAYEALHDRNHPAIETRILDRDNLLLDIVDSKGGYLIYVQRLRIPRIAVIGRNMRIHPPAIFPADRNDGRYYHTVISNDPDSGGIRVIRKNPSAGRQSPPLVAPRNVANFVTFLGDAFHLDPEGRPLGLAVPYSEIVEILDAFCRMNTIPAQFVVEDIGPAEEPSREPGEDRKETEYE